MRSFITSLLLVLILFAARLSWAADYYYSSSGLDTNPCTPGSPCKSINSMKTKAATFTGGGNRILLKCGETFRPTSHPNNFSVNNIDGTSSNYNQITSYGSCTYDSFGIGTNRPVWCGTGSGTGTCVPTTADFASDPEAGVAAMQFIQSDYWIIENLEIVGYGLMHSPEFSAHQIVRKNRIRNQLQECIHPKKRFNGNGASDITYDANEIGPCGIVPNNGEGFYLGTNETTAHTDFTTNIIITNNYIHDTINECLQTKPFFGYVTITNNTWEKCNKLKSPYGALHMSGSAAGLGTSTITNNWILDTPGGKPHVDGDQESDAAGSTNQGGSGIVIRSRDVTVTGNVLDHNGTLCTANNKSTGGHGVYIGDSSESLSQTVLLSHNTSYDNCNFATLLDSPNGSITLSNNLAGSNGGTSSSDDIGNDSPAPTFVNAGSNNWNLTSTSTGFGTSSDSLPHKGALQTLQISTQEVGNVGSNIVETTWSTPNSIHTCTAGSATVKVGGVSRGSVSCTIVGTTKTRLTFDGAAVIASNTVTVDWTEAAVKAGYIGTPYYAGKFLTHNNRSYTGSSVTNNTGGASAPTIASCSVFSTSANRLRIFLNTGAASGNVQPSSGAITFTARRNGASWALSNPAGGCALFVANQRYDCTMATSAAGGETVDVSWASGNVTGPTGIPLTTFTNRTCTNALAVPTYQNAVVANATPNVVNVFIDSAGVQLTSSNCANGFTVTGHTISSCVITGLSQLDLTLTTPFVNGETTRTISYNQATGDVTDGTTELATVTTQNITNNVAALTPPTFSSCRVDSGSANHLHVVFNPANSSPMLPATSATTFTARKAGGAWTVSQCDREGQNGFDCTMTTSATSGQALDMSWASGNVTNTAGTAPTAFSQQSCTNNLTTPPTAPAFINAVVEAGNPGIVLVNVDPAAGTMACNGLDTGCTGFTVSGSTVQDANRVAPTQFAVQVTPVFAYGDTRTISYDQSTGNVTNGTTELAAFSTQPITNSLPNPGGAYALTYAHWQCRRAEVAGDTIDFTSVVRGGAVDAACNVVPDYRIQVISQIECTTGDCPGTGKRYIASDDAGSTWYVVTDTSTSTDGKLLQFAEDSSVTGFAALNTTALTGSLTGVAGGVSYKAGSNASFPIVTLGQGEFTKYRGIFRMSSSATAGSSTVRLCMEQQDGTDLTGCGSTYTTINAVKATGSR